MNELETMQVIKIISKPQKVWSRKEVLSKPSPIPMKNGIYARMAILDSIINNTVSLQNIEKQH